MASAAERLKTAFVLVFAREIRVSHGEAPLCRVFWLYGVGVSWGLVALYVASLRADALALQQGLLGVFALYTPRILISIWRCSWSSAHWFWGMFARWLTAAWAANAALLLFLQQLELLMRYAAD